MSTRRWAVVSFVVAGAAVSAKPSRNGFVLRKKNAQR